MGAICAGAIGPSLPQIQLNNDVLHQSIKTAIEGIPDRVRENCEKFPIEIQNSHPQPYCVPHTEIKLTKDTPDEEIAMNAIIVAFGQQTRGTLKETVWKQLEPQIDEQLNEEEISEKQKQTAKDKFRQNIVNKAIDAAMDEALEKMKEN